MTKDKATTSAMAKASGSVVPAGYGSFLEDIKSRLRATQPGAALAVVREEVEAMILGKKKVSEL